MATVKVKRTNPGIEIEITDELVLKLFMDVAALKAQQKLIGGLIIAGFSVLAALIVAL